MAMRTSLPTLAILLSGFGNAAFACSCFGPDTFCGTLNPPYEEPEWWIPDAVVLAVPQETYYYGIDVVIVQVIQGEVDNDTVRVWGDNGALCRNYAGWAFGDTLILGIDRTDLAGNTIVNPEFPEGLEQPEDYMISGCGVYVLDYTNGHVRGWITAPSMQDYTLADFVDVIDGCALHNGVHGPMAADPLIVRNLAGTPVLELHERAVVDLELHDLQGRCVLSRNWDGTALALDRFSTGTYIAQVRLGSERWIRKVHKE